MPTKPSHISAIDSTFLHGIRCFDIAPSEQWGHLKGILNRTIRIRQERKQTFTRSLKENIYYQLSSVVQSCLTLCDTMSCSTPGRPAQHLLPEPTQTHVHQVGDAIQPSHPPSSPSPPAVNLSQHQSLFQ